MKAKTLVIAVIAFTIVILGFHFILRSKANTTLPECKYGPTDAVLNEPCTPVKFYP